MPDVTGKFATVTTSSGFHFTHAPHAVVIESCPKPLIAMAELEYMREVAPLRYGWKRGKIEGVERVKRDGRTLDVLTVRVRVGGEVETQSVTFEVSERALTSCLSSSAVALAAVALAVLAVVQILGLGR